MSRLGATRRLGARPRLAAGATSLLLACSAPAVAPREAATPTATTRDPCPPLGWLPRAMVSTDLTAGDAPRDAKVDPRVLAWRSKEDARPLHVDEAIVVAAVTAPGKTPWWLLLHVFRHPDEPEGRAWRLAQIADTPVSGVQRLEAAPGPAEIDAFMRASSWHEIGGFREVAAGTCREAWPPRLAR